MEASKAPKKIYLFKNPITEAPDDRWLSKRSDENDIEYVRTDAFIEKACEWLKTNATFIHPRKGTEECIINLVNFKEYMKGE